MLQFSLDMLILLKISKKKEEALRLPLQTAMTYSPFVWALWYPQVSITADSAYVFSDDIELTAG